MSTWYELHDSPVGELLLACNASAITQLHIASGKYVPRIEPAWVRDGDRPLLVRLRRELDAYFAGTLRKFSVAIDPQGTEFQRRAWAALMAIPFGETRTYARQAQAIGRPAAVRAIGAANGRNPIAIVVPCHRVVGADGSLTGYAGGLGAKEFLLRLEGAR